MLWPKSSDHCAHAQAWHEPRSLRSAVLVDTEQKEEEQKQKEEGEVIFKTLGLKTAYCLGVDASNWLWQHFGLSNDIRQNVWTCVGYMRLHPHDMSKQCDRQSVICMSFVLKLAGCSLSIKEILQAKSGERALRQRDRKAPPLMQSMWERLVRRTPVSSKSPPNSTLTKCCYARKDPK